MDSLWPAALPCFNPRAFKPPGKFHLRWEDKAETGKKKIRTIKNNCSRKCFLAASADATLTAFCSRFHANKIKS